ncbi:hypothetical protein V8F20_011789 [Naviculisporaceae sp. PSN 640]
MDFINKAMGGGDKTNAQTSQSQTQQSSSGGGIMGKINSMAGGGPESEKNEDFLDKGVDFVQERMGGGDQSNESAMEQAKDEQISDFIRDKYKSTTGQEMPFKDK